MSEDRPAKILIADDEPLFLRTTAELLRRAGYECTCAADGKAALEALGRESFDLILSDLNMPGNFKLELLREGRTKWPEVPLIVVTGAPSLPTAIESVRLGITDYLLKPIKYEDLLASLRRALAKRRPQTGAATVSQNGASTADRPFPEIIGESLPMQELFEIMQRVAATDTNVLISGESGTGKELVAKAIHNHSRRAKANFQIIDCTAIPETLFESIVFGHAKGAFTGAVKDHPGLLKQCDGGTAFFDEIGELPAPLQAKLLRVIQEQTFIPVGKTTPVHVDTRFLCATNRDLEMEVNAGRFRRDLFYRLAVIHIELPPLRERGEDIYLLAMHFLRELQGDEQRVKGFTDEARAQLLQYTWPGNIRELRNVVERAVALARSEWITPADLPPAVQRPTATTIQTPSGNMHGVTRADALEAAEREYLVGMLSKNHGNIAQTAREAGVSRQGLHKLLKKHGIDADEFRK